MAPAEVQSSRASTAATNIFSMAFCIAAFSVVVLICVLSNGCACMLVGGGLMHLERTAVCDLHRITAGCVCAGGSDVFVFAGGSGVLRRIQCRSLPKVDDKTRAINLVDHDVTMTQTTIWRPCEHAEGFLPRLMWCFCYKHVPR